MIHDKSTPATPNSKLAWFKWFPADWQTDHQLRDCSIGARGLWIEMLNIAWQSPKIGYLCDANGAPLSDEFLSKSTRVSLRKFRSLSDELRVNGIFSVDKNGVIFCRKMVRDEEKRRKCAIAGKSGGGNPRLKVTSKPTFKAETETETETETDPLPPRGEGGGDVVSEIRQTLRSLGVNDPAAADKAVSRTSPQHALQVLTWVASQSLIDPDGRTVHPYRPEVIHNRLVNRGELPMSEGWGDPDPEWERIRTAQAEREEQGRQQLRARVDRIPDAVLESRHGAEVDQLNLTEERRRLVKESRQWQIVPDRDIRRELLRRLELQGGRA